MSARPAPRFLENTFLAQPFADGDPHLHRQ
jgi:hypothetical protein